MQPSGVPIEDLLIHADFLRRLARDLVGEEAGAEDLAQEVWLQALRRSPGSGERLRGWLATTARNLLANRRRAEGRRSAREAAAGRPEGLPSTADVLAREETRSRVVRAVLSLEGPLREALLLRYYEGLAPREIAGRLGLPAATVRTRIHRGLGRLRGLLDAHHGERRSWVLLLLPCTRGAQGAGLLWGLIAMKKVWVALAVLLVAAAALRMALQGPSIEPGSAAVAGVERVLEPAEVAASKPDPREPAEARAPLAAGDQGPVAARRVFPAERGRAALVGEVLDEFDRPMGGVRVLARPHLGSLPPGQQIEDDRRAVVSGESDAEGRFRLEGIEEGPVLAEALFESGGRAEQVVILAADEVGGPLRFTPPHTATVGERMHVRVVDESGRAVPRAEVELFGWSRPRVDPETIQAADRLPLARGTADEDGRCSFEVAGLESGVVFAADAEGRRGWNRFIWSRRSVGPLAVTLAQPGSLHGELSGVGAEDLAGATLSLHALVDVNAYYTSAGRRIDVELAGPRFELTGLAPGTYGISLRSPRGLRLVVGRARLGDTELENSVAMPEVTIEAGQASGLHLALAPGARLVGRVRAAGHPVPGARVRAVIAPRTSQYPAGFVLHGAHVWRLDGAHESGPKNPLSHIHGRSDAEGRYELIGLQPGRYRLEVSADGLSFDRRMDLELQDGETLALEHELVEAGVLQVATLDASYLGLIPQGTDRPEVLAIVRDGFATFPGLIPGLWSVARFHSDESVSPVVLGQASVLAGRTTWIDLRAASVRAEVQGVVLAGGFPVPGARVSLYPSSALTDERGFFRMELGLVPRFGDGFGAHIDVRHAGTVYRFVPDSMPRESVAVVLDLGSHELVLELVDADGRLLEGRVEFDLEPAVQAPEPNRSVRGVVQALGAPLTLGPLPAGELRGRAILADGLELPFTASVPRAEPLRLERPAMGVLHVAVERAGQPVPGARVTVFAWRGPDPAPEIDAALWAEGGWPTSGHTDDGGNLTLTLPAGELLVSSYHGFLTPATRLRTRLVADEESWVTVPLE